MYVSDPEVSYIFGNPSSRLYRKCRKSLKCMNSGKSRVSKKVRTSRKSRKK